MDKNTKFGYWVKVAPIAGFRLEGKFTRPEFVGKVETPKNLDNLSIGQLIDLSSLSDTNESLYVVVQTILGLKRKEIDKARAFDVVRFVGWVSGEVERINKIFESTNTKPTAREKKAGIEQLNFGLFGMIDWYAKRMGIQDHDQVLSTPWLRIYKCIDMDNKRNQYERRYQEIMNDEINHRKG